MEKIQKTLEDLIRFRSVAKVYNEEVKKCADYIEQFFVDTALTITRIEQNGVPSIIITKNNTKNPKVFLCGHFDIVEGEDNQFEPRQEGDKIFGRGAEDMKSGVATLMHLMRDLADTPHDVGAMFTGDEEVGGLNGTEYILDNGYSCQVAIIPDGGEEIHKVVIKEKGLIFVDFIAEGVSYHGSRPWKGVRATSRLIEALTRVQKLFIPIEDHPEDHWVSTFNIGKIEGGVVHNQIAASAKALCDLRFPGHEDPEKIINKIKSIIPEGVSIKTTIYSFGVDVDENHELIQSYSKAIEKIGRKAEFLVTHGRSDGAFFGIKNIAVIQGQPDGGGLHSNNEWVSIPALGEYYTVVKEYLDDVALLS